MRLKIVSTQGPDGQQTRVVDAETGESIDGVTSVAWAHAGCDELPMAWIQVLDVEAEVEAEVEADQANEITSLSDKYKRWTCRDRRPS